MLIFKLSEEIQMKRYKTIQFFFLFILFTGTSLSALADGKLCVKNKSWTIIDAHFSPSVIDNKQRVQSKYNLAIGQYWCVTIGYNDKPHARGGKPWNLKAKIRGLGKKNPRCKSVDQREIIENNLKVTWKISGTLFGAKCRKYIDKL